MWFFSCLCISNIWGLVETLDVDIYNMHTWCCYIQYNLPKLGFFFISLIISLWLAGLFQKYIPKHFKITLLFSYCLSVCYCIKMSTVKMVECYYGFYWIWIEETKIILGIKKELEYYCFLLVIILILDWNFIWGKMVFAYFSI